MTQRKKESKPLADQLLGKSDQEAKLLLARAIEQVQRDIAELDNSHNDLREWHDRLAAAQRELRGDMDAVKALVVDQTNPKIIERMEGWETKHEAMAALVTKLRKDIESIPRAVTQAVGRQL